jgi:two-component system CheB/CheR fusion protein
MDPAGFSRIVDYLRQTRGVDFAAYKPTSVMRRVSRRMQTVEIDNFDAYLDHLEIHPDEFGALFNTILINVTGFFRDKEVWETLRSTVVPDVLARRPTGPIRVWSAGCASGQEPFSIAIVLAEALGAAAFRERVKIYATDIDDDALEDARRGVYSSRQMADVPADIAGRYFQRHGTDTSAVERDIRRSVVFGRHDLIQDAPISRVDLLLCRNTLMYFNAETQTRVMARFAFSLMQTGYLVLGRAEMLFSHVGLFEPIDLKRRIFKALARANHRERLQLVAYSRREDSVTHDPDHAQLREAAFDKAADAQIVVNESGIVIAANNIARRFFGIGDADIGHPLFNLDLSSRPADLRTALDRMRIERREIAMRGQPWDNAGAIRFLDVVITPLAGPDGRPLGARVSFSDVTPVKVLEDELAQSKQELDTAYEELQSTNEELETTNEELQSTVEELETTNEELQSTNEELETMNEELQSTNEELQTMNDELRNRSTELNSSNAFLEAVFTSLRAAVIVVDRELRVQVWNQGAMDMWGLRPDEAQGSAFYNLDVGFPVGELHQQVRDILSSIATHREAVLPATNRKGRSIRCRVSASALRGSDRSVTGAILLMEEDTTPG